MEKSKIAEWELNGDFGVLTINNPPQNYLDDLEFAHYDDVAKWTGKDSPMKGLVTRGKGRHFCAGANRDNIFKLKDEADVLNTSQKCFELFKLLYNAPVPTVAAIEGICWGGGLELALGCDIKICSEKALFSLPEAGEGIIPLFGVPLLPDKIGIRSTLDLTLSTRIVNAEEALELGFVDYVVKPKTTFEFALEYLGKLTRNRSVSVIRAITAALRAGRNLAREQAGHEETRLAAELVMEQLIDQKIIEV